MRHYVRALLSLVLVCWSTNSFGESIKITGQYKVHISKNGKFDNYRIEFQSKFKTGRLDRLDLMTDHVHLGLEDGAEVKLSAEVVRDFGVTGEISQVLVFLPRKGGSVTPVWLLSSAYLNRPLRGARYLEMHAPTSDYLVL